MPFVGCEFEIPSAMDRAVAVEELKKLAHPPLLVLDTCQRLEIFGLDVPAIAQPAGSHWRDAEAFERLARIAAGLESRVLGELEVLGQVRTAYKEFIKAGGADNSRLDRIFQDALSLARDARRQSGIDKNLISLGALSARELMARVPATAPVAVVGSGSIAGSVARYLKKRGNFPVRVTSRCPENAMTLAMEVGGFGGGLDNLAPMLDGVAGIVTATAAPHPILYAHHLQAAKRPLVIVDLGVPPDCSADVSTLEDVTYLKLEEIEAKAQFNSDERRQRADVAARIIKDGAIAWSKKR